MSLFFAIAWALIGAAIFSGFAFCWLECRRKDDLDRRARREIERATRFAELHPIEGRREAA